ncbi:MAG: hypothetical protein MK101_08295 [Phycisphaerales bacterium]|nr:hypothetical protein [Phycisphaerales bacterium]
MRYICTSIVATLALAGTVHAQPVQWTIAEGGNGHWYEFIPTTTDWHSAQAHAKEQGGELASISSVEENAFIHNLIPHSAWIGATDEAEEGNWQWSNGDTWDYTNWGAGEPNNNDATYGEDYAYMVGYEHPSGDDYWYDGSIITADIAFVIEWDHDPSIKQWRIEEGGNGHWYEAIRPEGSFCWEDARADAVSQGGYLATITSQGEQDFLESNVIDSTLGWFVGGYQDTEDPDYSEPNGGWKWVTGEPWDYTHWYSGSWGEMPHDPSGNENILALGMTWWGLMWKNAPACTDPGYNGYIIEYTVLPGSALGACCLDGLCITTASADCEGHGGTWGGPDSSCADFSCPTSCPGDTNDDGVVNIEDLLNLIGAWGACP